MKKIIKQCAASLALLAGLVFATIPGTASAINVFEGSCGSSGSAGTTTGAGSGSSQSSICGAAASDEALDIVKNIISTLLFVLGIVAVIMIIIGGIRYATSNGDSSQLKAAKDTILYAVIGLVVAIMSFAIVQFVVGRLS